MVIPFAATPAEPIPAMARPAMRALFVGAQPHKILPVRKMTIKERYTRLIGKTAAILPARGVMAHVAKVKAAGYQAI
jgi:hypothetical protein